jgi:hypothetical protein
MIKQLQLRGISRTPSDRATSDGGCAESLNVHLDQNETAPTLPPVDISESVYGANRTASDKQRVVYIHKMPGIVNYIAVNDSGNAFNVYAYGSTITGGMATIYTATGTGESLNQVASIGNTLIVYSGTQPHYFLFKDNAYSHLGSRVPVPAMEVASMKADVRYTTAKAVGPILPITHDYNVWNAASGVNDEYHADLLATMDNIWDSVSVEISEAQQAGVFVAPFFIRYAVRLYDGSYIHTSTPILCGGGVSADWMSVAQSQESTLVDGKYAFLMNITMASTFRVWLHGSYNVGGWSDIVKSIDIFASTPIYAPAMNAGYFSMDSSNNITLEGMDTDARDKTILDEVLSKGQFYKVMSINVDDATTMGKLSDGTLRLDNASTISGEGLALNDDMPDGYRDGNQYIPEEGTMNYNNHLMLFGAKELLSHGDRYLNGQEATGDWASPSGLSYFTLRFKVVDSTTGAAHYVLANYGGGASSSLYQAYFHNTGTSTYLRFGNDYRSSGTFKKCDPYAWICYPDTRCTQVEVFCSSNVKGKLIPMQPHPLLNCSYAFIGLGTSFRSPGSAYSDVTTPASFTEDPVILAPNKLFLSEFENPFLFPAGNIVTFSDKVVGAGFTSVPLSEGQLGDFPIYVFTEGGIRVAIPTGDGKISATMAHPNISRHVAIPGTILSMEQAIVFTTKKGVMMLSGNQVTELSRNINGAPFILNGAAGSDLAAIRTMLLSSPWASILGPTIDEATFMGFMSAATPAYDHNGARLLFFHPTKTWQYAYMLETQTWHKVASGISDAKILNGYPDCLVSVDPHNAPALGKVVDFSTVLDDSSMFAQQPTSGVSVPQPVRGIIVTRPFDLDAPDVRKAIRSLRVRGDFNRQDVQYLLLGSFDGLSWKHLTSLRGGSYKLFRLILLTNLMPKERITWIDFDFDIRFTNRLR